MYWILEKLFTPVILNLESFFLKKGFFRLEKINRASESWLQYFEGFLLWINLVSYSFEFRDEERSISIKLFSFQVRLKDLHLPMGFLRSQETKWKFIEWK